MSHIFGDEIYGDTGKPGQIQEIGNGLTCLSSHPIHPNTLFSFDEEYYDLGGLGDKKEEGGTPMWSLPPLASIHSSKSFRNWNGAREIIVDRTFGYV